MRMLCLRAALALARDLLQAAALALAPRFTLALALLLLMFMLMLMLNPTARLSVRLLLHPLLPLSH